MTNKNLNIHGKKSIHQPISFCPNNLIFFYNLLLIFILLTRYLLKNISIIAILRVVLKSEYILSLVSREFSCHAILSLLRLRLQKPFERKSRRFVVCATRFNRILDNVSSFHSFFPPPPPNSPSPSIFLRFKSFYISIALYNLFFFFLILIE